MPPVQSPVPSGDRTPRLKSGRKPLQPKNTNAESPVQISKASISINDIRASNKENHLRHAICATPPPPPPMSKLIQRIDSSLAEELSAMRKRMERLRIDGEKTEKMLKERGKALDLHMKKLQMRGEAQMMVELEVDRLFRLKELHSHSMRISPIISLRDKEQEKKMSQRLDKEEEESSSGLQCGNKSPCCSSTSSNSISTPMTAVSVA